MDGVTNYFHRISIIGVGLIGGSWGLALRDLGYKGIRVGFDKPEVLNRAQAAGALDEIAKDVASAVRGADLVILATPVGAIIDLLGQLKPSTMPRALVTDVGSTKRLICRRAEELFGSEPLFLGGHPMSGKERSGFENAEAALLQKARYVLTPLAPGDLEDERVKAFSSLVESVGARPLISDPQSHDRAMAFLSHVPQLLSTGLASLVAEQNASNILPVELAASGFRDVTRLADSPYGLWRDICLTNIENIQSVLESLVEKLEHMKLHLTDRELEREFKQALKLRDKLREIT